MTSLAPIRSLLCLGLFASAVAVFQVSADEPVYRDSAQLRADLVKVLSCDASRGDFMRLGEVLTDLYYGKPTEPALDGWKLASSGMVAEFAMPEAVEVHGHKTWTVMMAGEGLLAVLDGDFVEPLSKRLKLEVSDVADHIRTRTVSSQDLGDGARVEIVQTVSTITTHPGKMLVGCEYRSVF